MEKMIQIILDSMNEVLELDPDEMKEMLDENLVKLHLIDSLSAMVVMRKIELKLGKTIDMQKMKPEDITTVRLLAKALIEIGRW